MSARHFHQSNRLRTGRRSIPGQIYLITTVTRNRVPVFLDWDSASTCARVLHQTPEAESITSLAWVLMPDHVHWLFCLDDGKLEGVVRRFKSCSARAVNTVRNQNGPLWQAGYHDHALRREEDVRKLARYIVANPLRAGLCQQIEDYPFWDAAWL